MAQIYKEQVQADVKPMAPDTGIMEYAGKLQQKGVEIVDKNVEIFLERKAKEEKSLADLLEMKAKQTITNAQIASPNDYKAYITNVDKGLKTIYASVPDSPQKARVMAEVEIFGSGVNERVKRNEFEKKERIWVDRQRELALATSDNAVEVLGSTFQAGYEETNLTEPERVRRAIAYNDATLLVKKQYENRNAYDSNGNPVYTDTQKAMFRDRYENMGYYSIMGYAQNHIQSNYNAVVDVLEDVRENKQLTMQKYQLDEQAYTNLVKGLDNVITYQTTPQQLVQNRTAQIDLATDINEFELKDGVITNRKKDNLESILNTYDKVFKSENQFVDKDAYYKELAKFSALLTNKIESSSLDLGFFKRFGIGKKTMADTSLLQTNTHVANIVNTLNIKNPDDVKMIKAQLYRNTLVELKKMDADINSTDNLDIATKASNYSYVQYVKNLVPEFTVPKGEEDKVIQYANNALLQYNNQVALSNLQTQIQMRLNNGQ